MNKLSPASQTLRNVTPIISNSLTPRSIYGNRLVQWLRADLGMTTVAGLVSNWADQSGNGNHAEQTVAGSRPTYVTSGGPGNNPYVFSDTLSATPWLNMDMTPGVGSTTADGWTVMMIQTCFTAPGVAGSFWSTVAGSIPADGTVIQWRRDSGNRVSNVMSGVGPAPSFLTVVTPDMVPTGTWVAVIMTVSPSRVRTITVYGDGTTGSNTDTKTNNTNIELGAGRLFRDGGTFYQSLGIQELVAVNRYSTPAEQAQLVSYIRTRGLVF